MSGRFYWIFIYSDRRAVSWRRGVHKRLLSPPLVWRRSTLFITSSLEEYWNLNCGGYAGFAFTFISLGPHLCGASGFIFAADGIERRRWWAWAALCLITCIGGINDTSGAYYYYLYTGDLGFLIPLSATIMGAAGLFILTDCLSSNCTQRNPRPPLFSSIYTVGRYFAIIFTSIATICWLYCYLFFFLPAYLVNPGSPSSLLRIDLPAFNNQIPYISEKTDGQARRLHSHLQGFSVMVGQMGWAAGSVGFAITPLIAAVWGLVDCDIAVRRKCLWFLGYTSVLLLTCSYFSTLYVAPFLKTIHGMTCHDIVYSLLLRFYGYSMGASVIVMSISLTDQNCEIPPKNKKK